MKIVIDKTQTNNSGVMILEQVDEFEKCINKIKYLINSINTIWEGEDSLIYINQMQEKCIPEMDTLYKALNSYGKYLAKVGSAYEILDETFVNKNIDV